MEEEEEKKKEEKKRKSGNGGRVPQNHVGGVQWATEGQAVMDGNVKQRKREKSRSLIATPFSLNSYIFLMVQTGLPWASTSKFCLVQNRTQPG